MLSGARSPPAQPVIGTAAPITGPRENVPGDMNMQQHQRLSFGRSEQKESNNFLMLII